MQLLSVHWRKFVVTSHPDADGIRHREFATEAAASSFMSLLDVVVAAVALPGSSPALLAMLLRFLELLNKVPLSIHHVFAVVQSIVRTEVVCMQTITLFQFHGFVLTFRSPLVMGLLQVCAV